VLKIEYGDKKDKANQWFYCMPDLLILMPYAVKCLAWNETPTIWLPMVSQAAAINFIRLLTGVYTSATMDSSLAECSLDVLCELAQLLNEWCIVEKVLLVPVWQRLILHPQFEAGSENVIKLLDSQISKLLLHEINPKFPIPLNTIVRIYMQLVAENQVTMLEPWGNLLVKNFSLDDEKQDHFLIVDKLIKLHTQKDLIQRLLNPQSPPQKVSLATRLASKLLLFHGGFQTYVECPIIFQFCLQWCALTRNDYSYNSSDLLRQWVHAIQLIDTKTCEEYADKLKNYQTSACRCLSLRPHLVIDAKTWEDLSTNQRLCPVFQALITMYQATHNHLSLQIQDAQESKTTTPLLFMHDMQNPHVLFSLVGNHFTDAAVTTHVFKVIEALESRKPTPTVQEYEAWIQSAITHLFVGANFTAFAEIPLRLFQLSKQTEMLNSNVCKVLQRFYYSKERITMYLKYV
jgi:hypothetical protein